MATQAPAGAAAVIHQVAQRLFNLPWRAKLRIAAAVFLAGAWSLWVGPLHGDEMSLLQAIHGALRMFLLDPPDAPSAGASPAVFGLYWVSAFTAPLVAAGAFAEALSAALRSLGAPDSATRRMRGHLVVGGLGRHGELVAQEALKLGLDVAAVDRSAPASAQRSVQFGGGSARVPVIEADLLQLQDWIGAVAAKEAAQVWLCSGDPLRNLQLALNLRAALPGPTPRIVAVVDQADLRRLTDHISQIELFDEYGEAAEAMVAGALSGRTAAPSSVAIVGYGRLGKAVLRAIFKHPKVHTAAGGAPPRLQLIDPILPTDFCPAVEGYAPACTVHRRTADLWLEDAALARAADAESGLPSVIFSCVDDDRANLALLSSRLRHAGPCHLSLRVLQPLSVAEVEGVRFHELTELQRAAVHRRLRSSAPA